MMNKYIYVSILAIMNLSLVSAQQINHLTKLFLHQGTISDKVVCYFTKDPIFNKLPQKTNGTEKKKTLETMNLFLPMTMLESQDAKGMLKKIQGTHKNNYSIEFNEVTKPIKGIKITITYNPEKIIYEYQLFDAITGNKGLVFTFHNKDVLSTLQQTTGQVLKYAHNSQNVKPKIMLDIGHGGSDEGKVGCFNVKEKVINFQVGTKVATFLKKNGCEVFLTRQGDYFVALDDRTTISNKKKVDLFLSIHANSGSKNASGIETYWLDSALLKKQQEGDAVIKKLSANRDILSSSLAQNVHNAALVAAKKIYDVVDRKVKKSVTQVLLGTEVTIPAALIEIGFLSHEQETKYLMDKKYQMIIAQGIAEGIINYLKERV